MASNDQKKSCCTSFWLSLPQECSCAIDDAIVIIWYWCSAKGPIWLKKSFWNSFWLSWPKDCNGATIFILWTQHSCQWHHMTKSHIAPHFGHLDLKEGSDAIDDTRVMLHLITIIITLEMQWCHWWHLYNHLDLRNALMPLLMLLASCGPRTNGVTWPKETCCLLFICLYLRKMMSFMMLLVSCNTDIDPNSNCFMRAKKPCHI